MENVHFFYISRINLASFFCAGNIFLRLNLVYSFAFNYVVVTVLIFKYFYATETKYSRSMCISGFQKLYGIV